MNAEDEKCEQRCLMNCDICQISEGNQIRCANIHCLIDFSICDKCSSSYHGCCTIGCKNCMESGIDNIAIDNDTIKDIWLNPTFKSVQFNRLFQDILANITECSRQEEASYLKALREQTFRLIPSGVVMCSGHLQSRLLSSITISLKASRILELGTHVGYSALTFAESIPDDGTVTCCEIDKRAHDIAVENFAKVDHGIKINMSFQPAMSLLQDLVNNQSQELEPFDIIFIDADKKSYIDYYNFIVENKLLSPNGLMIVDNVLWKGLVAKLSSDKERLAKMQEEVKNSDKSTRRKFELAKVMHNFLTHVKSDNRVDMAILPFRDGIGFIRWL